MVCLCRAVHGGRECGGADLNPFVASSASFTYALTHKEVAQELLVEVGSTWFTESVQEVNQAQYISNEVRISQSSIPKTTAASLCAQSSQLLSPI